MDTKGKAKPQWRDALLGAVLCAVLGVALDSLPLGDGLVHLSYDLGCRFRPVTAPTNVVIVYMDEKSFRDLRQKPTDWDRTLYADLIDWLTRDQARLIVLDVVLTDPGIPSANEKLANAIRKNGRVVLAASHEPARKPGATLREAVLPLPQFRNVAAGFGFADLVGEEGTLSVVRRHPPGEERKPSLPWQAATVAGGVPAQPPKMGDARRWLNYYGSPGALPNVSFSEATNQPAGYFSGRFVFIGGWRKIYYAEDRTDEFPTPLGTMSGVEIVATTFLNLMRNEGWTRLARADELSLVAGLGLLLGFGLNWLRPGAAIGLGLLAMPSIAIPAILSTGRSGDWWAWSVPVFAQIPLGVVWSWLSHTRRLQREKEFLTRKLSESDQSAAGSARRDPAPASESPAIPDHTLLRCVGKGAYGEVWLARNRVGLLHAVKIVHRRRFDSDRPYEREFQGIESYMPVSRSHRGLVHVLHVGRDDARGFFFYIMEAGDDERTGPRLRAEDYQPATLDRLIKRRGRLPGAEVLALAADLCEAVRFLHEQGLVHRDLKPSNIIYTGGVPKVTDAGLVAPASSRQKESSLVGTAGFLLSEAAGTVEADLYALGKVLYVALTGFEPGRFPEVPPASGEPEDDNLVTELMEVAWRACAIEGGGGYSNAAQMSADLIALRQRYPSPPIAEKLAPD